MTKIWFENINILFDNKYILEMIPNTLYDINRNINAIVRLSISSSIILYLYSKNSNYFCIPLIVIISCIIIYKNNKSIRRDSIYNKMYDNNSNKPNTLNSINDIDSSLLDDLSDKRKPTLDNPFMNMNMIIHDDKSAYTSYDNKYIKDTIEDKFNYNLYKNPSDIYNNQNSQNRFYTMPVTEVINNQMEFAELCYGNNSNCKEGKQCDCVNKRGTTGGTY